jgi:radical SAM protein with 4Fe4S-binding SPASM domain
MSTRTTAELDRLHLTEPSRDGLWPLPEMVGGWGTRGTFDAQRPESGQWVFWQDRTERVLRGEYNRVLPLHVEVSPTYLCNFACPWCSCRMAREEWGEEDVFTHPRSSPLTVMRQPRLDAVVDHLAEHEVEIMWVGGEPTMNPLLYPAVRRAHERGLNQCIFTNGSLLNRAHAETLFDAGLVFVRVSLNSVSPDVHQRQHDYDSRLPYARRVVDNLDMLAEIRSQRRSRTLLGVSVVVDDSNIADLPAVMDLLATISSRHGPGAIDYLMLRPAFPLAGAHIDVAGETRTQFLEHVRPGSPLRLSAERCDIRVIAPEASMNEPTAIAADDLGCLAAGWFGEVTPSGDMLPCSDLYGDPEHFIGNLADSSLTELWDGPRRDHVLKEVRNRQCASTRCPANGRGHHLNRVFREVERLRRLGRLPEVEQWIAGLRRTLPKPEHSFFL